MPVLRKAPTVGGNFFVTTIKTVKIKYTLKNIDELFETLVSTDSDLKIFYDDYIKDEYQGNEDEKISYIDIAEISRYIVTKFEKGQTEKLEAFFNSVEIILQNCDSKIEDLIVVGLFESIQNIGGPEINYYSSFDKWLKPLSKTKWDGLIDLWEGNAWRKIKN